MEKDKDYVSKLSEYIKKNLKKGYTKDSLRWALISQGHSKIEVEKAFRKVDLDFAKAAPVLETKPEITYEVVSSPTKKEEKKSIWKKIFGKK